MGKRHECRYFQPKGDYRGFKRCTYCGKRYRLVRRGENRGWEVEMSLHQFADKWLPAVSGTDPTKMMQVDVAFPFEWNSYESWDIVFRVTFDLPSHGLARSAPTHVLQGWTSSWHEVFNRIDAEAEARFTEVMGRPYEIGDNTYTEMRRIIQAPIPKQGPQLVVVDDDE